ncbi:Tn3 family transposase [Methylosinus sp. KRF6]|uniref:Tn3 family transposase n=1 Tax=Methylosinus sp. KRF6 TaxID=2846853 RepID=UPI001C0E7AB9|nr:Tn3 family transposase [Methylosinus sp. KRF6]MBU3890817.1 transposase [Methylosinus sp. KRF6]
MAEATTRRCRPDRVRCRPSDYVLLTPFAPEPRLSPAGRVTVLWNTVDLSHAVAEQRSGGERIRDDALAHIAPLGWEHITFNGGLCLADRTVPECFPTPPRPAVGATRRGSAQDFGKILR